MKKNSTRKRESRSMLGYLPPLSCTISDLKRIAAAAAIGLIILPADVQAEGSKDLYPSGAQGSRSYLLSRRDGASAAFAPYASNGTTKVYVKAGEKLHMGFSMQGMTLDGNTAHIVVRRPDGTKFGDSSQSGTTVGRISNRTQELGGPFTGTGNRPSGQYQPYTITADQEGVWEVDFMSLGSGTNHATGTELGANANWTQAAATGSSALIAAWDVSVGDASGTLIPGRVFTTLFMGTGPNSVFDQRSFYGGFYVLTPDGYAYRVNANGKNGASFSFFSNNKGPVASGTQTPTYKSFMYNSSAAVSEINNQMWNPLNTDSGTNITNKLFYNKPATDLPATARWTNSVSGQTSTSTWLRAAASTPSISDVDLDCDGVISFRASHTASYVVDIVAGANDEIAIRNYRGNAVAGQLIQVKWDKKNNSGAFVPAGTGIKVKIELHGGEVHFPLIDSESNLDGLQVQLLDNSYNPITGRSTVYWDDSAINPTNSNAINGASNPKVNLTGLPSVGTGANGHKWGGGSSGNTTDVNYFGNNALLDTWTYVVSPSQEEVAFLCMEINGSVWNDRDANGLTGSGEAAVTGANGNNGVLNAGQDLYVNLIDATGNVVATAKVGADGKYTITTVNANTAGYKIQLSTVQGSVGQPMPATQLPAGWVNTAERTGEENTATQVGGAEGVGIINFNSQTKTVNGGFDFGIQQAPVSADRTLTAVENPRGTTNYTVAGNNFTSTDPNGGSVASITINAFPENATSITIGSTRYYPNTESIPSSGCTNCAVFPEEGVKVTTNTSGVPQQTIAVDPVDGQVNVKIPFVSTDNAGATSITPGIVVIPFTSTTVTIAGKVWNDTDGNATVEGTEKPVSGSVENNNGGSSVVSGSTLYASLLDATGKVVASVPVNPDGTYAFTNISKAVYSVALTTTSQTVGANVNEGSFPANWVATGTTTKDVEGDLTPNTSNKTGIISLGDVSANVSDANFGIQEIPTTGSQTLASTENPGGTTTHTVPATGFTTGDSNGGTVSSITITEFPTNATSFTVTTSEGSTTYYPSAELIPSGCTGCVAFPSAGVTVPTDSNGQPTQTIAVDPIDGAVNVTIPFIATDNAGASSNPATPGSVIVPFTPQQLTVTGKVWNDVDGDATVDGTEKPVSGGSDNNGGNSIVSGGTLYANLLDENNNVITSVAVAADGTYTFTNLSVGEYAVALTTNELTSGSNISAGSFPTNWVATGVTKNETGADAANTANKTGVIDLGTISSNVSDANFGIQEIPTTGSQTLASTENPGGTTTHTVPATGFTTGDSNGGTVSSITITEFPTNATSFTVTTSEGSTTYYPSTEVIPSGCTDCVVFPEAGVTVPTDANGQPTQTIAVDPIDGAVNVTIPFIATDNAGASSNPATPGSVIVPFTVSTVSIAGTIWHDVDGDGVIDGTERKISGTADNNNGQSSVTGSTIYASLLDASGEVVAVTTINVDGTYSFENVPTGAYSVAVTTTSPSVGDVVTAGTFPTNWSATGVSTQNAAGEPIANITNKTGVISLGNVTSNVEGVNFGMQQPPVAQDASHVLTSVPAGGSVLPLNNTVLTSNNGTLSSLVYSDDNGTSGITVTITSGPSVTGGKATGGEPILLYNGNPVNEGESIPNFDPSLLAVQVNGEGYSGVTFKFVVEDAAGAESPEATYTVEWSGALPVRLVEFTAKRSEGATILNWTTAVEENASHFEVERKGEQGWSVIGTVQANGTTSSTQRYSFVDNELGAGLTYYRLKTVDFDGKQEYSKVVSIAIEGIVGVYPNPASDYIQLNLNRYRSVDVASLKISDLNGVVRIVKNGDTQGRIEVNQLETGIYFVIIEMKNGQVITQKILINR